MSIASALKDLVEAFGGDPTAKNISGLIEELAEAVDTASEEGGIVINQLELPTVTATDNGKVLTVVSGEWAAAAVTSPEAELPAVTSADNGKVLTVVDGEWAAVAASAETEQTEAG